MRIIRAQINWPRTEYSSLILLKDFFNNIGQILSDVAWPESDGNVAESSRSHDRPDHCPYGATLSTRSGADDSSTRRFRCYAVSKQPDLSRSTAVRYRK